MQSWYGVDGRKEAGLGEGRTEYVSTGDGSLRIAHAVEEHGLGSCENPPLNPSPPKADRTAR